MNPPRQHPPHEQWEEMVRQSATAFPYPPTPNMAERVAEQIHPVTVDRDNPLRRQRIRRLQPAWVVGIILALLIGLLAVPPVRAAILEFLQIGAVRIWLVEPTPASPGISSGATPTPLPSLFDLAGETTLAQAEAQAGFSVRLPTYPRDLGAPDGVFYQELGGPVIILVWREPERPEQTQMSLHILGKGAIVEKGNPTIVMTTTVNGDPAAWAVGPYLLAYGRGSDPEWEMRQLVSGRVLIWVEDGLTYRLESKLSMEEAVRIAESLE